MALLKILERDYVVAKARLLDETRYCRHWGDSDTFLIQFITPYDQTNSRNSIELAVIDLISRSGLTEKDTKIVKMADTIGLSLSRTHLKKLSNYLNEIDLKIIRKFIYGSTERTP